MFERAETEELAVVDPQGGSWTAGQSPLCQGAGEDPAGAFRRGVNVNEGEYPERCQNFHQ